MIGKNGRMTSALIVIVFGALILKSASDKERNLLSTEYIDISSKKTE